MVSIFTTKKLSLLLILLLMAGMALLHTSSCTGQRPVGYNPAVTKTVTVTYTPGQSAAPSPTPTKAQEPVKQSPVKEGAAKAPEVEVVFVLDTTESMAGLIKGAQEKIWSIANTIQQAEPKPLIRFGLVGYRDVKDEYVTKVFGLTDNMDAVYANLMGFDAWGGGDTPEHVNKALYDALHQIQWAKGKNVLRIIFLVGDAPPHVDYRDAPDYQKLCGDAKQKDIIINTIRCGSDRDTEDRWKEIAALGGGKYASIDQSGGVVVIDTPMDRELADLNVDLGRTLIAYGNTEERHEVVERQAKSEAYAPAVQAERAKFSAGSVRIDRQDLVDAVKNKEVSLASMKPSELPEEMQNLDADKREKFVEDQAAKREAIKKKIQKLSDKRDKYIQEKQKDNKDSFDAQVGSFLKVQAKEKGLEIK